MLRTVVFVLLLACSAEKANTLTEKDIVGIWQNNPSMAAGWNDTYRFFADGKFIFSYNQMLCDKRTQSYSGTWELTSGDLILNATTQTIVEGGELVPATGSCASDYEIEGGEVKETPFTQTFTYSKLTVTPDKENRELPTMILDQKNFWKLKDDPEQY
jgi:hypothetical protein